jgi:polysaccharide pyruvyl transferase WcaK-like protein
MTRQEQRATRPSGIRVVVTNHTSCHNKGNEALVKTLIREISAIAPGAQFSVFSRSPSYDQFRLDELGLPVRVLRAGFPLSPGGRLLRSLLPWSIGSRAAWLLACASERMRPLSRDTLAAFRHADLVVSTDDIFSTHYGDLRDQLAYLWLALRYCDKVALLGHTIGPFERSADLDLLLGVFRRLSLITSRDSPNYEYLRGLKLGAVRLEHTADMALLLPPASDREVEQLLRRYRLDKAERFVAVMPSHGIVRYSGISQREHQAAMADVVSKLLEAGTSVILVPHVTDFEGTIDDSILCAALAKQLGNPPTVTILSDQSAEEIRGLLGHCDLVISERLHGLVAAAAMRVPAIAVAYSPKVVGLMSDLLGDLAPHLTLDVQNVSGTGLIDALGWLAAHRKEVAQSLERSVGVLEERARDNFRYLREILASSPGVMEAGPVAGR